MTSVQERTDAQLIGYGSATVGVDIEQLPMTVTEREFAHHGIPASGVAR